MRRYSGWFVGGGSLGGLWVARKLDIHRIMRSVAVSPDERVGFDQYLYKTKSPPTYIHGLAAITGAECARRFLAYYLQVTQHILYIWMQRTRPLLCVHIRVYYTWWSRRTSIHGRAGSPTAPPVGVVFRWWCAAFGFLAWRQIRWRHTNTHRALYSLRVRS